MINLLLQLVQLFTDFAIYVASGVVTVLNVFFEGIAVLVNVAIAVLPTIPIGETKLTPKFVEEANWFFPFGGITTVLSTMLTAYLAWMGVRYILRLSRAA
jgi:hypothetical protein